MREETETRPALSGESGSGAEEADEVRAAETEEAANRNVGETVRGVTDTGKSGFGKVGKVGSGAAEDLADSAKADCGEAENGRAIGQDAEEIAEEAAEEALPELLRQKIARLEERLAGIEAGIEAGIGIRSGGEAADRGSPAKGHLSSVVPAMGRDETLSVPRAEMAMLRDCFPDKTDSEIAELYRETIN